MEAGPHTQLSRPPNLSYMFPKSVTGLLGDLHVYDPAAMAWTDLSAAASSDPPSPRASFGFAPAMGKLYVHGGQGENGMWPSDYKQCVRVQAARREGTENGQASAQSESGDKVNAMQARRSSGRAVGKSLLGSASSRRVQRGRAKATALRLYDGKSAPWEERRRN